MVSMGSAVPPRLAIMVVIVIFCFSFLWSGTSSRSNFAAQAFIPPVGPISGRIVFSSDAFLVLRSSNDETGERATTNHPPPLAFLDDRYADLFRVKKEPTSVWGSILGRLHNRHKPAANSADVKHKYDDQVTPSHLSLRSRSPPSSSSTLKQDGTWSRNRRHCHQHRHRHLQHMMCRNLRRMPRSHKLAWC